ncbi:hypothetical protein Syun_026257 [Stephania yunnanensis]|uniref:Uncharacterized protein n=1 Tax=Stephania yunnanensis TaxID=152371 RepID=A0AAP0EYK2_9MAGN
MIQLQNWKQLQCPHLALQLAPTIKKIVKHLILKNSLFGIVSSSWRTLSKYKPNASTKLLFSCSKLLLRENSIAELEADEETHLFGALLTEDVILNQRRK